MKTERQAVRTYTVWIRTLQDVEGGGTWVVSASFSTLLEANDFVSEASKLLDTTFEIRPTGPPG